MQSLFYVVALGGCIRTPEGHALPRTWRMSVKLIWSLEGLVTRKLVKLVWGSRTLQDHTWNDPRPVFFVLDYLNQGCLSLRLSPFRIL